MEILYETSQRRSTGPSSFDFIMACGRMRVLELFCGIGGCAAALGNRAQVVAAVDIDADALDAYRLNFAHPTQRCAIESLRPSAFGRNVRRSLVAFAALPTAYAPRAPPRFGRSPRRRVQSGAGRRVRSPSAPYRPGERGGVRRLAHTPCWAKFWRRANTASPSALLCPTELGIPNRRPRFYLAASQDELLPWRIGAERTAAAGKLPRSRTASRDARAGRAARSAMRKPLNVVRCGGEARATSCFTSAYGLSPVHCGSYLATADGVRRFTPGEILRLLGFPAGYRLPARLTLRRQSSLAGNSLSVPAVRGAFRDTGP